jgi:acetate---CoA ligase (ADP-forming)
LIESLPGQDRSESRGIEGISALVRPKSIAVVGASTDPSRLGGRSLAYLRTTFAGTLYPVNPHHSEVQGIPAYSSVAVLPEAPDLALVLVSSDKVIAVAEESAAIGTRSMIVFSSGFSEAQGEGRDLQTRLTQLSVQSGMRILGPNTNGLLALPSGAWTTFAALPDPPLPEGPIAIVSQSGAVASSLFQMARDEDIPVSYYCGTGNEADLTVADMLAYFVEQTDVGVLVACAETIRHPGLIVEVARRARKLDKLILFMKVGRSHAGQKAALSHTGSITGSDSAVDATFDQHGILRPRSIEQMLQWMRVFSTPKRPRGKRTGIMTSTGGIGIMLADAAEDAGLEVPELDAAMQNRLSTMIPSFGATANPVDVTGQVVNDPELFGRVVEAMLESSEIDLLVLAGLGRLTVKQMNQIQSAASRSTKPVIAWHLSSDVIKIITRLGVPAFRDPVATMEAAAALVRHSTFRPSTAVATNRLTISLDRVPRRNGIVLEHDARELLEPFGIPQLNETIVQSRDEAASAAAVIGYPVALKALSYDYTHKSDIGAVCIGLRDQIELERAYQLMEIRVSGTGAEIAQFLVQEMAPQGLEMICGLRRDADFGPIVTVGLGGSLVEIISAMVSCPALLSTSDAMDALSRLCGGRLVRSKRGLTYRQQLILADLMVGLGRAGIDVPEIEEVDLNPVIVAGDRLYVADAVVVLNL